MEKNVTIYGEWAGKFDKKVRESIEILDAWVAAEKYSGFAMTTASITIAFMHVGQSFVDLLRLGNGVRSGTLKGVGADALRLITVAGPAIRLAGTGVRLLGATQAAKTSICTWVSHTQAIRQAGQRFFLPLRTLFQRANVSKSFINQQRGTSIEYYRRLQQTLKHLRITALEYSLQSRSVHALENLIKQNPRQVFTFAVDFVRGGKSGAHAMHATAVRGTVLFFDTNRKIYKGAESLLRAFSQAKVHTFHARIMAIPNAIYYNVPQIVSGAQTAAGVAAYTNIALEVIPTRSIREMPPLATKLFGSYLAGLAGPAHTGIFSRAIKKDMRRLLHNNIRRQ